MKWIWLAGSIILEVAGTTALKVASQGGKYAILWSISVFGFYASCFFLMGVAFRHFDLGLVYAVWSGVGTSLVAIIGVLFFGDGMSLMKIASITLIIIGIVGLNLAGVQH